MNAPSSWKLVVSPRSSPNWYYVPPEGFIKLNFDGASKGNPGEVGFGGLFRDSQHRIKIIYETDCGYASNNEAEFTTLL